MKINVELKNVNYIKHNNFEDIEITENGEYTASEGYNAIGKANVNVQPNLEEIEITENGEYLPSEDKDGFSKVEVLVQPDTQEIEITENGEYTPSQGYIGFSKVDVNVETYEPPLNLVLTNPTTGSSINLPITFQWNIDNLEQGETPVYYLFVDDTLVYKGSNNSYTMEAMPIAGRNHTCYVVANTSSRSSFTDSVSFNLPYEFLYGFDIDQDNEDPTDAVTYTDDCLNFTPAGLDENNEFQFGSWKSFIDRICRPVMLRLDGTVDYELNHDNLSAKLDGTSSDISNLDYDGNVMVEFKKTYTKVWQEGNIIKVRFCDVRLDSDFQAWAFVNDDGDEQDELYISMFQAIPSSDISRLMSIGESRRNYNYNFLTDITDEKLINKLTDGYGRLSFTMMQFLKILHILISKSRDFVNKFGRLRQTNSLVIDNITKGGFIGTVENPYLYDMKSFYIQYLFGLYIYGSQSIVILDGVFLNKNRVFIIKNTRPYEKINSQNEIIDIEHYTNTGIQVINTNYRNIKSMIVKNGIMYPDERDDNSNKNWKAYINKSLYGDTYHVIGLTNNAYESSIYSLGIYSKTYGVAISTFITYIRPSNT